MGDQLTENGIPGSSFSGRRKSELKKMMSYGFDWNVGTILPKVYVLNS